MGIRLDPKEIEINAGLRAVAKLFLNSYWGKVRVFFAFSLFHD